MLLRWFSTQDWNRKPDRQLDVIDARSSWDQVSLLSLDQILNLFESLWTIDHHLRQREMMREPVDIVWNQDVEAALWTVDISDLKDLHVIAKNVTSHLKWCHINNLHIRVF